MADEKKLEEMMKARKAAVAKLRGSVDAVLRTEEGRAVFAYLFHDSLYNQNTTSVHPQTGETLPGATAFNDGRRALYISLRRLASYDLLQAAEELAERPPEENQ